MKARTSVSLMVAITLGIITAYVGTDLMRNYRGRSELATKVLVAKKDMKPGYVVQAEDLETSTVSVNLIPAKALRDPDEVVGRTVVASIVTGQTMIDAMLAPKGAGSGLAAIVPPGMRAVAVDVSDSSAVAGMITGGSKVDVIATLRRGDQTIAKAVVEDVEVQAVQRAVSGYSSRGGQTTAIESGPVKSVTLLVTPKQASALELASAAGGRTRLVLRGNGDTTKSDGQMSANELAGIPDEPAVEPTPPPVVKTDETFENIPPPIEDKGRPVEIIRGGASSTIYIDESKKADAADGTTASAVVAPTGSDNKDNKRRNPAE